MRVSLIAQFVLLVALNQGYGQEPLSQQEFEELHAKLIPENEKWMSVPWETDLLLAQNKAAQQNKLLFIWAMDGHPLGCT